MDGTLLDSEKVWDIALDELAESLGGTLSPEARVEMVGTPLNLSVSIVHAALGLSATEESALAASREFLLTRVAGLFAAPLPWQPGAQRLLDEIGAAGIPLALVTSTHRNLTELALRTLGADRFAAVVCGDEVSRAKPDPESYLRAAKAVGAAAEDCVAIEDSQVGLSAARSAGCAVVVVPSEVRIEPQPGITLVGSLLEVDLVALARVVAARRT
jgi:HAD superfamily hydrolase (TIGR01509 family)